MQRSESLLPKKYNPALKKLFRYGGEVVCVEEGSAEGRSESAGPIEVGSWSTEERRDPRLMLKESLKRSYDLRARPYRSFVSLWKTF